MTIDRATNSEGVRLLPLVSDVFEAATRVGLRSRDPV